MTLQDYINDLKIRIDDDPYGIDAYYTNAQYQTFLNNARKDISRKLGCYENEYYIILQYYIDEYELPADFKQAKILYDSLLQKEHYPVNKANAETTKTFLDLSITDNLFSINESRKKIVFLTRPTIGMVELPYEVKTFDRTNNRIVLDNTMSITATGTIAVSGTGVTLSGGSTTQISTGYLINDSAGTVAEVSSVTNDAYFVTNAATLATGTGVWSYRKKMSEIGDWDDVKGFAKIYHSTNVEYVRCSYIYKSSTTPEEYTVVVSSWDCTGLYKNMMQLQGNATLTNTSPIITSTDSVYLKEVNVGDVIYVGSTSLGACNAVYNNYAICVNTAVTTATGSTVVIYADSRPVFVDGDNVTFCRYVMNYDAIVPNMNYQYENDDLPYDVQRLVPVKAAVEAELRRSRPDQAQLHQRDYDTMLNEILSERKDKTAELYNNALTW